MNSIRIHQDRDRRVTVCIINNDAIGVARCNTCDWWKPFLGAKTAFERAVANYSNRETRTELWRGFWSQYRKPAARRPTRRKAA